MEEWTDPRRPAGSAYTEEEWSAAEEQNPGCVVTEVLKAQERALVVKHRDGTDDVLHRSLLIHQQAASPWSGHATAAMEHHGEFGKQRYAIVRSQEQREKNPWADGSLLVIEDLAHKRALEAANGPKAGARSRSDRFRN